MTYEQIIESLESCSKRNCSYCSYDTMYDTADEHYVGECVAKLTKDALSLIDQLKAEKDSLIKLIQSKQNIIGVWKELTEKGGAE